METNFPNQPDQELNDQKIRIKQYAYSSIKKRTYGLILLTTLIVVTLIIVLVYQRKTLILKKNINSVTMSESIVSEKFEGYKTILSMISFNMLADKFKKHKGVHSIESHPLKHNLLIKYDTSITNKETILRTLYTKAKLPISYPSCSQSQLTNLRLWISDYYDSYDGLIIRSLVSDIPDIYYLESGFDKKPYVDLIINKKVDIRQVFERINGNDAQVMDKGNLKKIETNYRVINCTSTPPEKTIDEIRRLTFPNTSFKRDFNDSTKLDSIKLLITRYDLIGGIRLRQLIKEETINRLSIISFNFIPDSLPVLKIVFVSKSEGEKERLIEELNKPIIISKSKFGLKETRNSFQFQQIN